MSDWIVIAGSAAIIAFMVAVAWLLGFRKAARIDGAELERLLALSEPGARVEDAAIAVDGRSALARLSNGKLMVAKVMGADITVRLYPASALALRIKGRRLDATFADLGFPALKLTLENDPPRWLGKLAARGGGSP